MNLEAKLTKREHQMASLLAWGAAKKEIALKLFVSVRTVENTIRSVFSKAEVSKSSELAAWWFCKTYSIPLSHSPLKKQIVATALLLLIASNEIMTGYTVRMFRTRSKVRTEAKIKRPRRNESNYYLPEL
ncbi:MAG: helix-turn-helix transcriptional regulator [Prolixibacteraceae bacterium]